MKKIILNITFLLVITIGFAQVGIGNTDPKAMLDITSTTAGVLIPRMSTATRTGLTVAADQNGMMVYDNDTKSFWYYDHTTTSWVQVASGSASKFVDGTNAADAVFTGGNVGIDKVNPHHLLDLGITQGKKLAVFQNTTGTDFYGFGIASIGSLEFHAGSSPLEDPQMSLKFNGFVGLGTANPVNLLHLNSPGAIQLTDAEILNTNANNGTLFYDNNFFGAGEAGNGHFTGDGGGLALYQSDHSAWGGLVDTNNMPFLNMDVNSLHIGGTSSPGDNNLIVDGDVGIGTTTPHHAIDLGDTSGKKLAIFQSAAGTNFYGFGIAGGGILEFHANSSALGDPKMVLTSTGNVGIGTTTLGGPLTVAGITDHANNAAAIAAGLVTGSFYRTGDLLKIVH